jgi:hypothetical protein
VSWSSDALALFWPFLDGGLFGWLSPLGHKITEDGASVTFERLGAGEAADQAKYQLKGPVEVDGAYCGARTCG